MKEHQPFCDSVRNHAQTEGKRLGATILSVFLCNSNCVVVPKIVFLERSVAPAHATLAAPWRNSRFGNPASELVHGTLTCFAGLLPNQPGHLCPNPSSREQHSTRRKAREGNPSPALDCVRIRHWLHIMGHLPSRTMAKQNNVWMQNNMFRCKKSSASAGNRTRDSRYPHHTQSGRRLFYH